MSLDENTDPRLKLIKSKLRSYPDFPIPGINFLDLFSVLGDKEAFPVLVEVVKEVAKSVKDKVDVIVGLDARGFLYGPIMAHEIGVPFVPV